MRTLRQLTLFFKHCLNPLGVEQTQPELAKN